MDSRVLVDKIGKPLELDTDGIWGLLPEGFPEKFSFQLKNGKSVSFSYPCSILNINVYDKYCNHQYQRLDIEKPLHYNAKTEMSIFFEVDGPYKAMIIPASREEDKMLKKRYAVYNFNGTIAEIKGFELKRRGELNIIKIFQQDVSLYILLTV
jgi:DNA polymerase epsilon subunit 1